MREWTEADEDRYRASERERTTALVNRIMNDAQKRYDQAEENYQSAGNPSSLRSMEKWRDLIEVCRMALERMSQSCFRCEQRYKNGKSIAEMLRQRKACGTETISIDEAIEQVRNAAS